MSPENHHLLRATLGGAAATLPLTMLGAWIAGTGGAAGIVGPLGPHLLMGGVVAVRAHSPWTLLAVLVGSLLTWCVLIGMQFSGMTSDADPTQGAMMAGSFVVMGLLATGALIGGLLGGRLLRRLGVGRRG